MLHCKRTRRGSALFELASAFALSIAIGTLAYSPSMMSLRRRDNGSHGARSGSGSQRPGAGNRFAGARDLDR